MPSLVGSEMCIRDRTRCDNTHYTLIRVFFLSNGHPGFKPRLLMIDPTLCTPQQPPWMNWANIFSFFPRCSSATEKSTYTLTTMYNENNTSTTPSTTNSSMENERWGLERSIRAHCTLTERRHRRHRRQPCQKDKRISLTISPTTRRGRVVSSVLLPPRTI